MWARVVECMLGCWLAISPFIFRHSEQETALWVVDWVSASFVIAFGLLSYWTPTRHIHVATALVAIGLIAFGRIWSLEHVGPGLQNHMLTGLLLLMFALIPNHASQPSRWWHSGAPETQ